MYHKPLVTVEVHGVAKVDKHNQEFYGDFTISIVPINKIPWCIFEQIIRVFTKTNILLRENPEV